LAHAQFTAEIFNTMLVGLTMEALFLWYVFFILKRRMGVHNAGAVAAAYGSVSAMTFVASVSFLESLSMVAGGHMVAVMALGITSPLISPLGCRCIWRLSGLRPDKFSVSFTPRRSLHAQDVHPGCK